MKIFVVAFAVMFAGLHAARIVRQSDDIDPSLPEAVDLSTDKCMPPVKDQGACRNGAWAFVSTALLEFHSCKKSGKPLAADALLSEQELIDCETVFAKGCDSGHFDFGLRYANKIGVRTLKAYPYSAKRGECKPCEDAKLVTRMATTGTKMNDRLASNTDIAESLIKYGPVAARLQVDWEDTSENNFLEYTGGVVEPDSRGCLGSDYPVLIVGYNTTEDGLPYWLLRTAMGPAWGMKGYMQLLRQPAIEDDSTCAIETTAQYVTAL